MSSKEEIVQVSKARPREVPCYVQERLKQTSKYYLRIFNYLTLGEHILHSARPAILAFLPQSLFLTVRIYKF